MQRLLPLLMCLGTLDAQMKIPLETKGSSAQPITVPLKNIKDKGTQAFVGALSVGTPPQPMPVTFDTAADVSFVVSARCQATVCTTRPQYSASASSTYQADDRPFELPYGQNVSGLLSRDVLTLVGATIADHTFVEITDVWSDWYNNLPQAGIVGLGLAGSPSQGVKSLLDILAEQELIPARQFGMWLGRDPAGGELTLGALNETRYSGQLSWVELRPPPADRQWAAPAQQVTFAGRPELTMCSGGACSIAPISSTPFFLMSHANAKAVNDALGGAAFGTAGAMVLDCATLCQLPNALITLQDGRTMEMTPLEYTFQLRFPTHLQMCVSGFLGVGHLDDSTLMLGSLFMQKFYTAYDAENGRLGFADSA